MYLYWITVVEAIKNRRLEVRAAVWLQAKVRERRLRLVPEGCKTRPS